MTRDEAAQRTSHLIRQAIERAGLTVSKTAFLAGTGERNVRMLMTGAHVARLDTLSNLLESCGFELVLAMKQVPKDDADEE